MRIQRLISWVIVAGLAVFLAGELIWVFWLSPRLVIRRVSLESNLGISDDQLMEMLNIEGETWAAVDERDLKRRLEAYPVVKKAEVVKGFPDQLHVVLRRRMPLAVAVTQTQGGPVPAVFDEEGYAVQVGADSGFGSWPVISGARFSKPELGARLPVSFHPILADLAGLRTQAPALFALISEVEIVPRGGENYDLRLYMNHARIPVLIDSSLDAEELRRVVLVIDVLSTGSAGTVVEADMRGGQVVYRRTGAY